MHQDPARLIVPQRAVSIHTSDGFARDTYRVDVLTLERELGRIVQHQDRTARGGSALASRAEVPRQDICFIDAIVIEEPIRRFGVGRVLARKRNSLSRTCSQSLEQRTKSLTEPLVSERATGNFAI